MERLYPTKARAPRLRRPGLWQRWSLSWAGPWRWVVVLLTTALALSWAALHLHYYNKLVSMETAVQAAWAQVETSLLRRHNVQQNLSRISRRYAQHEREVLTQLTELRSRLALEGLARQGGATATVAAPPTPAAPEAESLTLPGAEAPAGAPASPPTKVADLPAGLQPLGSSFALTAEQYPQLMLSKNMQQFSAALVEVETELARMTMAYNEAVNVYSTELGQFPGNIFGWLCGFKDASFYQPERDALEFREVEY